MSYCDKLERKIRQISPQNKVISNPRKMRWLTREKFLEGQEDKTNSKNLKICPERSWYTLLNTTVTEGRSVGVIKESKALPGIA